MVQRPPQRAISGRAHKHAPQPERELQLLARGGGIPEGILGAAGRAATDPSGMIRLGIYRLGTTRTKQE